jgi:hypothetical protein
MIDAVCKHLIVGRTKQLKFAPPSLEFNRSRSAGPFHWLSYAAETSHGRRLDRFAFFILTGMYVRVTLSINLFGASAGVLARILK